MNISVLAAGAGGMYCGSCMRDNALGQALRRLGHDVTLIPLYTPLRSEHGDASDTEIFYGGVNVFLQHATRIFRHTPRVFDWIFDRPWLLNTAGKIGAQTQPEKLAGLTMTIIEGEDGSAKKELDRLVTFLKEHVKPQVISLPNLMFIGMARTLRDELGVPVICEMTGEDIFLDAMKEPDRSQIQQVIRSRTGDVSRFVATTDYYAGAMAAYLGLPRERVDVVYTGISAEYFTPLGGSQSGTGFQPVSSKNHGQDAHAASTTSGTVGYLARICAEKGLARFVDAMAILQKMPGMSEVRIKVAGYLGGKDHKWFKALRKRIRTLGLERNFEYVGEVDLPAKLKMLDSLDVFSVPTAYPEAKGVYVLEAMARGVPVVQPAHGSFPEILEQTGGGVLVPPGDALALATAIAELLRDPARRRELGKKGRAAVESTFTEDQMAANMLKIFHDAIAPSEKRQTVTSAS